MARCLCIVYMWCLFSVLIIPVVNVRLECCCCLNDVILSIFQSDCIFIRITNADSNYFFLLTKNTNAQAHVHCTQPHRDMARDGKLFKYQNYCAISWQMLCYNFAPCILNFVHWIAYAAQCHYQNWIKCNAVGIFRISYIPTYKRCIHGFEMPIWSSLKVEKNGNIVVIWWF